MVLVTAVLLQFKTGSELVRNNGEVGPVYQDICEFSERERERERERENINHAYVIIAHAVHMYKMYL